MGYIKHDAMIVTARDIKHLRGAHEKAGELISPLVSEIYGPYTNGQVSFFIAPDGSKEGWPESNDFDEKRKELLEWLRRENAFIDYVHIRFGGDDDQAEVYTGGYVESDTETPTTKPGGEDE